MTSKNFSELFKIEPDQVEREFLLSVRSYGKRGDKEKASMNFASSLKRYFRKR